MEVRILPGDPPARPVPQLRNKAPCGTRTPAALPAAMAGPKPKGADQLRYRRAAHARLRQPGPRSRPRDGLDHTDRPNGRADHREQLHIAEAQARKPDPVVERSGRRATSSPSPGQCSNSRPSATRRARERTRRVHSRPPPSSAPATDRPRAPANGSPERPLTTAPATRAATSPPNEISSGMIR